MTIRIVKVKQGQFRTIYFAENGGQSEVKEFIDDLDKVNKAKVSKLFEYFVDQPNFILLKERFASLRDDVAEFKVHGSHNIRIYGFWKDAEHREFVCCKAHIKKTTKDKKEQNIIRQVRRIRKEYFKQQRG